MVHINLPGPPVEFADRVEALRFGALSGAFMASFGGGFLGFVLGGSAGVLLDRWGLRDTHMYIAVAVASGVGAFSSCLAAEHRGAWKGSLMCWLIGSILGCVLIYLTDNRHFTPERGVYQISLALTGGMTATLLAVPRGARAFARSGFTEGDTNSRKLLALSELAGVFAMPFGPARARVSFFVAAAIGASLSGCLIGLFVQRIAIFGTNVSGVLFCVLCFNVPSFVGAALLWGEATPPSADSSPTPSSS